MYFSRAIQYARESFIPFISQRRVRAAFTKQPLNKLILGLWKGCNSGRLKLGNSPRRPVSAAHVPRPVKPTAEPQHPVRLACSSSSSETSDRELRSPETDQPRVYCANRLYRDRRSNTRMPNLSLYIHTRVCAGAAADSGKYKAPRYFPSGSHFCLGRVFQDDSRRRRRRAIFAGGSSIFFYPSPEISPRRDAHTLAPACSYLLHWDSVGAVGGGLITFVFIPG